MFHRSWGRFLVPIVWVGLQTTSAVVAATITTERDGDEFIVQFTGPVEFGDFEKLKKATTGAKSATVVLFSGGGALAEGLRMGEFIRDKGFSTLVRGGTECASACGFMWLAGGTKTVEEDGLVGFHAVYLNTPGSPVSSDGNALAGAYMARLGYGDPAIVYATEVPPNDIRWLTPKDAAFLEIDVNWRASVPLQDIPSSISGVQIDEMLLKQPSIALLKNRAPKAFEAISWHMMWAIGAGQSWRTGFLGGLRAILEPGAELDQAGLRKKVLAAVIELHPQESVELFMYGALVYAETKDPERCANFGHGTDVKEFLDASIYPIGNSRPERLQKRLIAISTSVLERSLSPSAPNLKPLNNDEKESLNKGASEIVSKWTRSLDAKRRKLSKREFAKWPSSLKCDAMKFYFKQFSQDARLSALLLREEAAKATSR